MRLFLFLSFVTLLAACQSKQNMQNAETTEPIVSTANKENSASSIKTLPPQQFNAQLQARGNAQLLDVRTPKEYNGGYLDGAQNINFHDKNFQTDLQKIIDAKRPIFVYCQSGGRSAKAAKLLQTMGGQEIYDLAGGYTAWSKASVNVLPDTLKATTH